MRLDILKALNEERDARLLKVAVPTKQRAGDAARCRLEFVVRVASVSRHNGGASGHLVMVAVTRDRMIIATWHLSIPARKLPYSR